MFGKVRGKVYLINEINFIRRRKYIYGYYFVKIVSMMIDLSCYNWV